jgi:hypothetical protein
MNHSQREVQPPVGSHPTTRRNVLRLAVAGTAAPLLGLPLMGSRSVRAQGGEVRIGYQKGSANLLVLKAEGALEERLGTLGYTVSWSEFSSGPPLLEALNAGSIDFGATGAPPPIFAQAAGADLIYALASKPSPRTQAIIVPPDSAIQTPADLAGKKVAVTKGSSANALLVRALRAGGSSCNRPTPRRRSRVAASMPGRSGTPTTPRRKTTAVPARSPPMKVRGRRTGAFTSPPAPSPRITRMRWRHWETCSRKPISGLAIILKRWPGSSRARPGWMNAFC